MHFYTEEILKLTSVKSFCRVSSVVSLLFVIYSSCNRMVGKPFGLCVCLRRRTYSDDLVIMHQWTTRISTIHRNVNLNHS